MLTRVSGAASIYLPSSLFECAFESDSLVNFENESRFKSQGCGDDMPGCRRLCAVKFKVGEASPSALRCSGAEADQLEAEAVFPVTVFDYLIAFVVAFGTGLQ